MSSLSLCERFSSDVSSLAHAYSDFRFDAPTKLADDEQRASLRPEKTQSPRPRPNNDIPTRV